MNTLKTVFSACMLSFSIAGAQTYNGPESIEFDPNDGKYFVGNNGSGTIIKLSPNGTLQNFASGITSGPHGLELIADTLYVCDGANVRMVDRVSGSIIGSIMMGANFLNGATHKGNDLFVTDFTAKKIYRINVLTRQFNLFCSTLSGKTPNGIIYDDINDRLVYCCWGSNAQVHAINLTDSTITSIGTTTLGNCDGIAMNCSGEFYIASWSPNRVTKFSSTITSPTTFIATGLSSPADIYYNRMQDSLYVPNSGSGNNVSKAGDISCTVSLKELNGKNAPSLFPNPATDRISFKPEELNGTAICTVFDVQGKKVLSQSVSSSHASVDISKLEKGIYMVKLQSEKIDSSYKLIKE
ncbi:MAG: hypothetical protein K0S33_2334 [Bacteroidetes bacterium]|jgi:DNA-binding beta-propeller fold protein YncE|nr:hypothetical protein [Bacteroidota bacterium]